MEQNGMRVVLGFADDLDILGEFLEYAVNATRTLGNEVKKIGLQIYVD